MKFVHMADLHLDSPFVNLAGKGNLAGERRMEQRKAMKEIVEYIKENDIPYFFIIGDLYEHEYIKKSTIEYVNNLFKEIPNTKIFITPGNHDPYLKNSFYNQYKWSENVHIFTDELEIVETDEADIYGYGFSDFYMQNKYPDIDRKNPDKINILITHGSLDGGSDENREYNPMSSRRLKETMFDYIALGHIHKRSSEEYRIVYPGSTVSLGFDELGERGVIVGEIDENSIRWDFLPINTKTFEEMELDVTDIESQETLIENLNTLDLDENKYYKIILIGKRSFEINISQILEFITQENIIKIKNKSTIKYDIEEIAKQTNLKGLFAKNILNKINESEQDKEKLLNAFEIGIDILK